MYGLTVDFFDITEVSLLEKSMNEIGAGRRTNGYASGQTLKGNFESENLGKMLLFVQADTSPTILIKRNNDKDIYISFRDGAATRNLYNNLIEAMA